MIAALPYTRRAAPSLDRGFTLIEMMVGLTIGLIVLAIVTAVFVTTSANRRDTERVGRQIENGRYAVQVLADDLVNAGYFGEFDPRELGLPGALPDPCSVDVAKLKAELMVHVQGFGPAATKPSCVSDVKSNTSVIAVRRVATCVAGDPNCDAVTNGEVYFQSTLCNSPELADPVIANRYVVAAAPGPFPLHKRGCVDAAALRKYVMNLYFVANNNNAGDGIPTLKRAELSGGVFTIVPLVEGIEDLEIVYGLDTDGDSTPDAVTAAPATLADWANVVTARVHVLARTTEPSPGHTDAKTFDMGLEADGTPLTAGPFSDGLKRHAFIETVRINNPAGRRE